MLAAICDLSTFDHYDPISHCQTGRAVRDHHAGAIDQEFRQGLVNQLFALEIDLAGRFVQNQDVRVSQRRLAPARSAASVPPESRIPLTPSTV